VRSITYAAAEFHVLHCCFDILMCGNDQRCCSVGLAVAQHPSAASPQILKHTIVLAATVNSVPMTPVCRDRYRLALAADFQDLSRLINELICNRTLCPYMSGAPETGIPVNQSAVINGHSIFVAIDTASLSDDVSFDVVASTVGLRHELLC